MQLIKDQAALAGDPTIRLTHIVFQSDMGIFAVQACTKDGETEAVGQEGFVIAADRVGAVELCITGIFERTKVRERDQPIQMISWMICLMCGKNLRQVEIFHGTSPFIFR